MDFVNFTNYPSEGWDMEQINAAQYYGDIVDIPFPNIPPELSAEEEDALVNRAVADIMKQIPPDGAVVLVDGEPTIAFRIVEKLEDIGVLCLAATFEEGRFVQFRDYRSQSNDL